MYNFKDDSNDEAKIFMIRSKSSTETEDSSSDEEAEENWTRNEVHSTKYEENFHTL